MCRPYQKTDSPDSSSSSSSSSSVEGRPPRFSYILQFSGAPISSGDSGASTSKGDAGASTSIGDAGESTSKGDAGASTSIGDSGASTSKGDSGASTSIGDAGESTSKGDAGASTSIGDSGASTSKGDSGATTSKGDAGASTSVGDSGASTSIGDSGSSTSSEIEIFGPAGAAAMLFAIDREDSDRFMAPMYTFRQGLGYRTTSVAEYRGLILGLKETIRRGYEDITVQGSSELVVNQFLGNWEINDPELRSLCDEALELRNRFQSFSIIHIDKNLSRAVDYNATEAISLPDRLVEIVSFID